jgi:hypothetical protein
LLAGLHALGGNSPNPVFEIYLVPLGSDGLGRARSG